MNAGFSNLDTIKRELLLASDAAGTAYDDALVSLGVGVASAMEDWCARRFGYLVGDTYEFAGERDTVVLRRYPITEITSVEVRSSILEGWIERADEPQNFLREAGIVYFNGPLSGYRDTGRVTWTGGYWWQQAEPDETPDTQPEGAEALPPAILTAWLLQCKYIWDTRNIVERAKAGFGEGAGFIGDATKFLPMVEQALRTYRRLA